MLDTDEAQRANRSSSLHYCLFPRAKFSERAEVLKLLTDNDAVCRYVFQLLKYRIKIISCSVFTVCTKFSSII